MPDVRWACGFSGSNGLLLVGKEAVQFITDGRYTIQAETEVEGATLHTAAKGLWAYVEEAGLLGKAGTVLVQAEHLTVAEQATLEETFPDITWKAEKDWLQQPVAQKTEAEAAHIEAAQRITEAVFEEILPMLKPGVRERDIAAEIVYRHLQLGAERMSFDPIVATGAHGALPHARPGDRPIATGDLIVIDMGGFKNGYASDMTRTVAVGEPGAEARKVYQTVWNAQEAALDVAHAGMTAKALDGIARAVIEGAGYGDYFTHSLGHGVGLQIHEWPAVSYRSEEALPEGAVVTIEPGIYLPGQFGVRIEDMIHLKKDGCRNLTHTPKDLLVL